MKTETKNENLVLSTLYGLKNAPSKPIGMEWEVEFQNPTSPVVPWLAHPDGSLRYNGVEYVTDGPQDLDDVPRLLGELDEALMKRTDRIINSPRTSFHVHKNMLDKTPVQIATTMTGLWLMEPLLMELCAESRKGNLFCLRLQDARDILNTLRTAYTNWNKFFGMRGDDLRYGAYNIQSLTKFGTIESRAMDGEFTKERYTNWTLGFNQMVEFFCSFKNPEDLMEHIYKVCFSQKNMDLFISNACGKYLTSSILKIPGYEKLFMTNVLLLCGFAYGFNWDRVENTIRRDFENTGPMSPIRSGREIPRAPRAAATNIPADIREAAILFDAIHDVHPAVNRRNNQP